MQNGTSDILLHIHMLAQIFNLYLIVRISSIILRLQVVRFLEMETQQKSEQNQQENALIQTELYFSEKI